MNNDDIEEKLEEIDRVVSNVPDGVISAMQTIGFDEKLRLMAFDHKLTVEESGRLHDLVEGYILGGYEDEEFSKKLIEIAKTEEEASSIGKDLNAKILLPLRKQLVEGEFDEMERRGEFEEENTVITETGKNQNQTPITGGQPFSIIGNNLSSASVSSLKENDYSIPKMGDGPKKNDPYLEPLEEIK